MHGKHYIDGYESLRTLLELPGTLPGLQLSEEKTGFLPSSVRDKNAITMFRSDQQPEVHDLMKDPGIDSSGARRRRIGIAQKRLLEGRGRQSKLQRLKLHSRPVRIRIWKTSVHSAACYGTEAQGIAPQRRCALNLPSMEACRKEEVLTSSSINIGSFRIPKTRSLRDK